MFLFDTDIPLQRLSGLYVSWICFSEGQLKIKFDNNSHIMVIYTDDFIERNGIIENKYIFMSKFIGTTALDINIINKHELKVNFSNGLLLKFLDLEGDMENYIFYIDGVEYIV